MQAHTASLTAVRPFRQANAYQPLPYVLLRRSADDAPAAMIPKTSGLSALLEIFGNLFNHWRTHG